MRAEYEKSIDRWNNDLPVLRERLLPSGSHEAFELVVTLPRSQGPIEARIPLKVPGFLLLASKLLELIAAADLLGRVHDTSVPADVAMQVVEESGISPLWDISPVTYDSLHLELADVDFFSSVDAARQQQVRPLLPTRKLRQSRKVSSGSGSRLARKRKPVSYAASSREQPPLDPLVQAHAEATSHDARHLTPDHVVIVHSHKPS